MGALPGNLHLAVTPATEASIGDDVVTAIAATTTSTVFDAETVVTPKKQK